MKVVIYGVYGTIGKFLANSFLCDGHSVIGIYNNKIDKLSLKNNNKQKFISLKNNENLKINANIVINCAVNNNSLNENIKIIDNILRQNNQDLVSHFIHFGSISTYGEFKIIKSKIKKKPISSYGEIKNNVDNYLKKTVDNNKLYILEPAILISEYCKPWYLSYLSLIEKNLKIYLPNTNSNMPGIFLNDIYNYIDYIISSNYAGNDNFHLLINTKFMKKWKDYYLDIFSKKRYQKYFFIKEDQYYKINNKNFFDKIRNRLLSKFSNKIPFDDELLYLMKLDINKFDKFTSHGSFKYKQPYEIYNSFLKKI